MTSLDEAQVSNAAYNEGYRNGHLDRILGIRLRIAEFSSRPGYASGYRDGVLGLSHKSPFSVRS